MDFVRCNDTLFPADLFFKFTLTCRSPALTGNYYSDYQFLLYEIITLQREKGKTIDQIAEWLNKKGYLTVHGNTFKGNHLHSIVKKKRFKYEKLD